MRYPVRHALGSSLVVYNPYDWQTQEDPYPVYRRLRDEAPAYHNEALDFWALSRHSDVLAAFRDTERFSNSEGVALEREQLIDATAVMSFLAMDPPRHDQLRRLFVPTGSLGQSAALQVGNRIILLRSNIKKRTFQQQKRTLYRVVPIIRLHPPHPLIRRMSDSDSYRPARWVGARAGTFHP